ncbi:MAG: hypothetical protein H6739_14610 [Alphaproteobacteria bacterium]|nr:hypothetical protein [Alphaproteobacteria bacterium]
MPLPDHRPVIIGAGVSGLFVSAALARAGVPHLLLGPPTPPGAPRLGESLDTIGSLELAAQVPELTEFRYRKDCIALHSSGRETGVFSFRELLASTRVRLVAHWMLGLPRSTPWTFHVDRYAFDDQLFTRCTASPLVTHSPLKVTEIKVEGDRVTALHLNDGQVLHPSHVFDATNHIRLLGRALGVEPISLDVPRYTVFARYFRPEGEGCDHEAGPNWLRTTHLVSLSVEAHGVEGLVWVLPMPGYVSIGVSMDEEAPRPDDARVLEIAEEVCRARGLDWRARYPTAGPSTAVRHRYFFHERVSGENWMMIGGSAFAMHLASSSGLTSALAMAKVAPEFLRHPRRVGRRLHRFVRWVVSGHATFDDISRSAEVVEEQRERWIREAYQRIANHAALCSVPLKRTLGVWAWWFLEWRLVTNRMFRSDEFHTRLLSPQANHAWMNARETEVRGDSIEQLLLEAG